MLNNTEEYPLCQCMHSHKHHPEGERAVAKYKTTKGGKVLILQRDVVKARGACSECECNHYWETYVLWPDGRVHLLTNKGQKHD